MNKTIVSKIEKISQDSSAGRATHKGFLFNPSCFTDRSFHIDTSEVRIPGDVFKPQEQPTAIDTAHPLATVSSVIRPIPQKSGSFESTFGNQDFNRINHSLDQTDSTLGCNPSKPINDFSLNQRKGKGKHGKRLHIKKMQLQFEDSNGMECSGFTSSSSISSSDSEAAETNESDREGDDELTDWPGNEAMVNFASKNDFKRAKHPRNSTSKPSRTGTDDTMGQDDDTLMSADEVHTSPNPLALYTTALLTGPMPSGSTLPPNSLNLSMKCSPLDSTTDALKSSSTPIDIVGGSGNATQTDGCIESEMSGETSNHFSSPCIEVREFRAGCRRVRDERPGFTIFTSVNEHLSR